MSTCTRRATRLSEAKGTPCPNREVEGFPSRPPRPGAAAESSRQSGWRLPPGLCRADQLKSQLEGEGGSTLKLGSRSPPCRMPPGRLTDPRECPTLSAISVLE